MASLYGIGNYYIIKSGQLVHHCLAEIELNKETQYNVQSYERIADRMTLDTEAAITSIVYKVKIKYTDLSLDSIPELYNLQALNTLTGATLPTIDNAGAVIQTTDDFKVADFELDSDIARKFVGYLTASSGETIGVVIENMYRSSGAEITQMDGSSIEYIATNIKAFKVVTEVPAFTLIIPEIEPRFVRNSDNTLQGILFTTIGSPSDYPLTLNFDFAAVPQQTVVPNPDGTFSFNFMADGSFLEDDTGVLTLTANNQVIYSLNISGLNSLEHLFTATAIGGDFVLEALSVVGTGVPLSTVTVTTAGIQGIIDGTYQVLLDGTWSSNVAIVPGTVANGASYTITASTANTAPVVINKTLGVLPMVFNPQLTYQ